ncbi:hypothetical protein [uncultured Methanobrevibacter sp.]|uniref:hypothetical protein n=1 Tax=uncultured Methanobrevibacter sp. TaxID=253161 RepID=UPI0025F600AD|nr:hypothetical protein [uncultured Methanobrevibacter sp.]
MKKIIIVLIALIAIGVSIGAVSAEGFSFSFGSESNSDGGDISINNDKLSLQGIDFKVPAGFKENESARMVANATEAFGEKCKVSGTEFYNNETNFIVQVFFADDGDFNDLKVNNATNQTIAGHQGFVTEKEGRTLFDYVVDGKIVEINSPDQQTLESILKA